MKKKKHILVISQYFYPEQFRINDICTELVKRGYQVTVLTGIPNYPQGHFYEGYGYWKKKTERYNGIEIIRIPIIPRKQGSFWLVLNYLSFVVSGYFWNLNTRVKADVVFIYEVSPMTQALPAVWYAKKRKMPCYLYVQDLWPDNVEIITGIHNQWVIKPINQMVHYIYDNCNRILVTSKSFQKTIISRGISANKVVYWPQYAEDFYVHKPQKKMLRNETFKIVFTGNIGTAQGLSILPKAAQLLTDKNLQFVIVGDGRYQKDFIHEVYKRCVEDKFCFLGRKKPEEIPDILSRCDAAFLSFMDCQLFYMTIPAKLSSYLACGIPILASAGGESKAIIEEADCGLCSQVGDAAGLARNIDRLMACDQLEQMGQRSYNYYKKHFDKEKLMGQLELLLQSEEWSEVKQY